MKVVAAADSTFDPHLEQRLENERAAACGRPLPYPNVWDRLDPTKVPRDASPLEVAESYLAFRKLCPPQRPRTHRL